MIPPGAANGPLSGFTVAITAVRRRLELGAALEEHDATVLYAPALRIVSPVDDTRLHSTTHTVVAKGVDIVVGTTGIGFRGWIEAAEAWGIAEKLLDVLAGTELIARGPKVKGAMRAAGLTERWAPESESTIEVLEYLLTRELHGKRIAVQLHGEPLGWFLDALRSAGAQVIDVPVYRSTLPDDPAALHKLIHTTINRGIDCIAFTSAAASANFLRLAQQAHGDEIRRAMTDDVIAAAVGPVTAAPLTAFGIPVIQPTRFRLGALVKEIAEQVPPRRTRTVALAGRTMQIRGQAVVLDDTLLPIADTGIALLRRLAHEPGRVVSRHELLRALPGSGTDGHAVEVAIGRLRGQLGDPTLIETVIKRGYRLAH